MCTLMSPYSRSRLGCRPCVVCLHFAAHATDRRTTARVRGTIHFKSRLTLTGHENAAHAQCSPACLKMASCLGSDVFLAHSVMSQDTASVKKDQPPVVSWLLTWHSAPNPEMHDLVGPVVTDSIHEEAFMQEINSKGDFRG
ncbi:hypothetical protein NDU88_004502 [Pleurodeles waltl]|uniref:Uncharacterized protein n=1 Tax=Pleurodeles waltl TaxID=8319 RepID=A0AAV7MTM9_PLEWA|nr:hypothetical protein NDU88_004502 [Pleurodeles waltl]